MGIPSSPLMGILRVRRKFTMQSMMKEEVRCKTEKMKRGKSKKNGRKTKNLRKPNFRYPQCIFFYGQEIYLKKKGKPGPRRGTGLSRPNAQLRLGTGLTGQVREGSNLSGVPAETKITDRPYRDGNPRAPCRPEGSGVRTEDH
jgi:hypothetical protein